MRGFVTYEVAQGRYVRLEIRDIQRYGAATILRDMGYGDLLPAERVAVFQRGKKIGTLPADFDPLTMKSLSYLYNPRPDDFIRDEAGWQAAWTLGPGDLDAVRGFVWDRSLS